MSLILIDFLPLEKGHGFLPMQEFYNTYVHSLFIYLVISLFFNYFFLLFFFFLLNNLSSFFFILFQSFKLSFKMFSSPWTNFFFAFLLSLVISTPFNIFVCLPVVCHKKCWDWCKKQTKQNVSDVSSVNIQTK